MRLGSGWGTTSAVLAVVIAGLAVCDRFLEKAESAEMGETARRDFAKGSALLAKGKARAAVAPLSDAWSVERENSHYELQLAAAYTAAGDRADAEPLLQDVLDREPNSGPANLTAARWAAQAGKTADAEAHYHRYIYGEWPEKQDANRLSARMELVDLLAENGHKQELTGELISLEAVAPADASVQQKIASLYLVAGSPNRAAEIYRTLAKDDASDVDAYEGLGDAELQEGNYRAAGQAFSRALSKDPENQRLRDRVTTLNEVTGLDPTPRQLTSAEKYRRSVRILEMAREALDQCAAAPADADLLKASDAIMNGRPPAHATNEMAEQVLELAEKVWQSDPGACQRRAPDQAVLSLIMKKIAA